jgi:heat shock protein HtpX
MIATAITYLAFMLRWIPFFGSDDDGPNPLAAIAVSIIAPLAAMIIQAVDHPVAGVAGRPHRRRAHRQAAGAGQRPGQARGRQPDPARLRAGGTPAETNSGMQHLFIAAPFGGRAMLSKLFSTHPPIPERIAPWRSRRAGSGQLGPLVGDPV